MGALVIRKMRREDLERVRELEELCFDSPWSMQAFENELEKEYGQCFSALIGDEIVGYLIEWLVADEIHIANIAVHPDWRRQGIASELLKRGIASCPFCLWIGLEVRENNSAACGLYRKFGFYEVGLRKDYYGKNKDALLMVKRVDIDD